MDMFELKRFNLDIAYPYKQQYDNFIGGKWVAPLAGRYFDNVSPITGKPFCKVPQSDANDVNLALASADRLVFLREGRLAGETEPRRPDLDLMESVYGVPWELARTKGGTSVAVPRPGPVIPTAGRGR